MENKGEESEVELMKLVEQMLCNKLKIIDNEEIADRNVLLISETKNKILLPYTAQEIKDIIQDNKNYYTDSNEVIESKFTRQFSDYKDSHISRMKESIKLATEKEKKSKLEGMKLGLKMFNKSQLHPAIISACKNIEELNLYLECLNNNKLDEFKRFEIKYELNPSINIKSNNK